MKKEPVTSSPSQAPQHKVLDIHTTSSSSSKTSSEDEKEIEQLEDQFRGLQVNKLYHSKVNPTSLTKNWYPRPTPPNLQFKERSVSNQFSISSGKFNEWNIDGLSEQEILNEILNKIQHMSMVANSYLNENGTHLVVIELMVLGFTGKLLQWWNNYLIEESKEDIKHVF